MKINQRYKKRRMKINRKKNYDSNEFEILDKKFDQILNLFKQKIAYDTFKEQQLDKLHAELQEYKNNFLLKINRPFINELIYIYDDLDKILNKLQENEDTSQKCVNIIKNIKEDIRILLEENGVFEYREIGDDFNPKRQQVAKKIPISDEKLVGKVAYSIRVGFELDNIVIRKEKVAVNILEKKGE